MNTSPEFASQVKQQVADLLILDPAQVSADYVVARHIVTDERSTVFVVQALGISVDLLTEGRTPDDVALRAATIILDAPERHAA